MRSLLLSNGGIKATVALDEILRKNVCDEIIALDIKTGYEPARQGFASVDIVKWYIDQGVQIQRVLVDIQDVYAWNIRAQVALAPEYKLPLLASIAGEIAASFNCDFVVTGAIPGASIPVDLFDTLRRIIRSGAGGSIRLIAPNEQDSYAQVIRKGMQNSVPLQLTWSCRFYSATGCGDCPECKARAAAVDEIKSDLSSVDDIERVIA